MIRTRANNPNRTLYDLHTYLATVLKNADNYTTCGLANVIKTGVTASLAGNPIPNALPPPKPKPSFPSGAPGKHVSFATQPQNNQGINPVADNRGKALSPILKRQPENPAAKADPAAAKTADPAKADPADPAKADPAGAPSSTASSTPAAKAKTVDPAKAPAGAPPPGADANNSESDDGYDSTSESDHGADAPIADINNNNDIGALCDNDSDV